MTYKIPFNEESKFVLLFVGTPEMKLLVKVLVINETSWTLGMCSEMISDKQHPWENCYDLSFQFLLYHFNNVG